MRKRLGQHFLINQAAAKKIAAALDLGPKETIVEIGPGNGALTFPLLKECQKTGCQVIGIEKDPVLAKALGVRGWRLDVILGDVLEKLPEISSNIQHPTSNFKIVGNIPYYITGKLLRTISELENKPAVSILMIQKEVAERICARPPKMNLLAAAVQFWAKPKILFSLKPKDFNPPPEVESAVIKLETRNQNLESRMVRNYYEFIRAAFKQPRKTLVNNLGAGLKKPKNEIENALKSIGLDAQVRPQNLTLEQIKNLMRSDLIRFSL